MSVKYLIQCQLSDKSWHTEHIVHTPHAAILTYNYMKANPPFLTRNRPPKMRVVVREGQMEAIFDVEKL